ncbi:MAG: hypothetical protein PUG96_02525 [Prevotellaceae bacterium]|nr:hypothetical protein [Prevotellaceae bacterium]
MEITSIAIIAIIINLIFIAVILGIGLLKRLDTLDTAVGINFELLYAISHQNDMTMYLRLLELKQTLIQSERYEEVELVEKQIQKYQKRIKEYEQRN